MSFDLTLPTVCDHRIHRELLSLDDDLRTLRFSRPLAAGGNVQLYASEDLVPSSYYTIVEDTTILDPFYGRMIRFKNHWDQPEDYFEVNYVTILNYCPKCLGLKVLDDISYDNRGNLRQARDENLLLQNLEKFVITVLGSNPFHTYLGTSIATYLGERNSDQGFIETKITHEINTTLGVLKDMQLQYEKTGRKVTDGEMLDSIDMIKVNFDEDDPTIIRALITVQARSGKTIDYTQYLRIS